MSKSIFGFRLELPRCCLIFNPEVAYDLLSIILAESDSYVFHEYTLYTCLSVMVV